MVEEERPLNNGASPLRASIRGINTTGIGGDGSYAFCLCSRGGASDGGGKEVEQIHRCVYVWELFDGMSFASLFYMFHGCPVGVT